MKLLHLTRGIATFIVLAALAVTSHAKTWIGPDEVKSLPDGTVVVDARGAKDYAAGHLPGAVNAPWQYFSDMDGKPGDAGWGVVKDEAELSAAIGGLGIGNDTPVVVYSASPSGWGEDGRVAWTLRMAGVKDVSILDGGIEGWVSAGGEITTDAAQPAPVEFVISGMDRSLTATKEDVRAALGTARILDARTAEEYAGAQNLGEARGGHLPGAISLPWTSAFDERGRLRDGQDLRAMMSEAGIDTDDEIIAYCTAGIRSAHLALALREAGFTKARNYDASFHEWAGDESLPLE